MSWTLPATALAAYLIGGIPFGYLIYRALTGQDVRESGSGNIGATNVGRLLGFRYFVLVFVLDVLKGLLPTIGLPWLIDRMGHEVSNELPIAAAVGAILGHNFPVYLGFKGGKGVATSLGALIALQPVACGVAAVAFFAVFLPSHYVSLSSMAGGVAFAAAYFLRTAAPWSPEHRAMSILVTAVVVLLIVRHRKNISRLLAGTENRVNFGKRKPDAPQAPPSGKVGLVVVAVLAVVVVMAGVGLWVVQQARTPVEAVAGPWLMRETHRESTGQQRASQVAFDESGERLAVLCPRYNRVLTYRVLPDASLARITEIAVEGRPVAIAVVGSNLAVLQRPVNDAKHLGPGWLDVFALEGTKVGTRVEAGYYPDDMAPTPDGSHLLIVASGRGEGDDSKHAPQLEVFATTALLGSTPATPVSRIELVDKGDPDRLVLSNLGTRALVTLDRGERAVAIDLADLSAPREAGRLDLHEANEPYLTRSEDGDWIVVPARGEREVVAMPGQGATDIHLIVAQPEAGELDVVRAGATPTVLGRFPVRGPLNLGSAEASGLAYCGRRGLLAAATKPGTVHIVRMESRADPIAVRPPAAPVLSR
ncbi:glycerol-3-phosphate 1-O-acyltransferase PlsY [Paludisphaera rhizosphaerae]|uniref:glycerol-3-phosphate 1-O-acyltransferase PlsY n=1 Tax=Paludisphaera rhizosphaerae TaxID=2711216 RepID=UPI0013EA716A|nr:glycerol-3-phosphate 1-O-acyltransferase PlsY [Paludisphaera rhizosphaerae]